MGTGIVRWFNGGQGYGFIAANDGGDDVYAHYSAIETQGITEGFKYLAEGQKVEFDTHAGPKGLQAANIRILY
jgi:CspA family cold shock protein